MQVEVPVILMAPAALAASAGGESSAVVAQRVAAARERSLARQGCSNARLAAQALDEHAMPEKAAMDLLLKAAARVGWSDRSYHRVLRVARGIADLAGSPESGPARMAETVQLRSGLGGETV